MSISKISRLLTEKDAAEVTGYSRSWFQRKRWEGGGPPFRKIGHSVRYPEDELLSWIEHHALRRSTSEYRKEGAAA